VDETHVGLTNETNLHNIETNLTHNRDLDTTHATGTQHMQQAQKRPTIAEKRRIHTIDTNLTHKRNVDNYERVTPHKRDLFTQKRHSNKIYPFPIHTKETYSHKRDLFTQKTPIATTETYQIDVYTRLTNESHRTKETYSHKRDQFTQKRPIHTKETNSHKKRFTQ